MKSSQGVTETSAFQQKDVERVIAQARRPDLSLVEAPSAAVKARQLLDEARKVSLEHVRALAAAIETVRELSETIVDTSDLYGPGLSEFAQRLGEDLFWKSKTLEALSQRRLALIDPVATKPPQQRLNW